MQYFCNIFPDFGFSNLLHETEWDPVRRHMLKKTKNLKCPIGKCGKVNKHASVLIFGLLRP